MPYHGSMNRSFKAIFENGAFRPLQPIEGLADRTSVDVTITSAEGPPAQSPSQGIHECFGTISKADAAEMARIIEDEFERVDRRDW